MKIWFAPSLVFVLYALLAVRLPLSAATPGNSYQEQSSKQLAVKWQSTKAEHVYGLAGIRRNNKGTLTLTTDALTFASKSGDISIPRSSVTAMSAGNERVEIGGVGVKLFRMMIPDGGGLAAAAVMHHRIDMLTVEFNDGSGGNHAAVFFLPATDADRAAQSFALTPVSPRQVAASTCQNDLIDQNSVLVDAPNWDQVEVPAAYRALVYEHLIDRLSNTKGVGHIYRAGENSSQRKCPQYTVHIAVAAFREGSSVERAYLGPAGMFVGTTQMTFNVTFADASGKLDSSEIIKTTVRGESESTGIADHVAKSAAKRFAYLLKSSRTGGPAKIAHAPSM